MSKLNALQDILKSWTKADDAARIEGTKRLGLPDNNTAADRAKAMGFGDETYYHGSADNIDEFRPNSFFADNGDSASSYATDRGWTSDGIQGSNVTPIRTRANNPASPNDVKDAAVQTGAADGYDLDSSQSWEFTSPGMHNASDDVIDALKGTGRPGYDSAKHRDFDMDNREIDSLQIFDPANIRSPLAHFNPKMAGVGAGAIMSSNLMASDAEAAPVTKIDDMLKAWAKADKEAQQEAVKRLGLGPNNTAQDRAKAMGFSDETYYHGTSEDFNEFNDVTTYVSPSPDIATDFAFMDNGGGYALDGAELTEDMLRKGNGRQYSQPNIMPLKVRASDTFDYANPSHIDEISPRVGDASIERIEGGNYEDIEDVIPEIKRKDFDSIRVNESQKAGFDSTIDNLGVFNPNGNIRSKFAHFNPKMAGIGVGAILSANLMADELDLEHKPKVSAWDSLMNTIGGVNQEQAQAYGDTGAGALNLAGDIVTEPDVAAELAIRGVLGLGVGGALMSNEVGAAEKPGFFEELQKKRVR